MGFEVTTPTTDLSSIDLQQAYDNSDDGLIDLDATRGNVEIRDTSGELGASLLRVASNGGTNVYFDVVKDQVQLSDTLAQSLVNLNDTDTGIGFPATGQVSLFAGGNEVARAEDAPDAPEAGAEAPTSALRVFQELRLPQLDSTESAALTIYNDDTSDEDTNYERLRINANAGIYEIRIQSGGTGSEKNLLFSSDNHGSIMLIDVSEPTVRMPDGSSGSPGLSFLGDLNTGLRYSDESVIVEGGGNAVLTLDGTPANSAAAGRLQVHANGVSGWQGLLIDIDDRNAGGGQALEIKVNEFGFGGDTIFSIEAGASAEGRITSTATLTASSGTQAALHLTPTINQSGTAAYTGILLNVTETGTGSGSKNLLDLQVGGVSKAKIDSAGDLTVNEKVLFAGTTDEFVRRFANESVVFAFSQVAQFTADEVRPQVDNSSQLGSGTRRWSDLYVHGVRLPAVSAPGTDANHGQVYVKDVGSGVLELFFMDEAGNETQIS